MFSLFSFLLAGTSHAADVLAMNGFVEKVAEVVESRVQEHELGNSVQLSIETGGGVDRELTRRFFGQQLTTALRRRGVLFPKKKSSLKLALVVSIRGEKVWVVGDLIDEGKAKNILIVVENHLTADLAAALGARRSYLGSKTWEVTQVANLAPGVLNLCFFSRENYPQGTLIATVHLDGVRLYEMSPSGFSPAGGPFLFEKSHRWPRVRKAWLAARGLGQLEVATTGGGSWLLDIESGKWSSRKEARAPLPQPEGQGEAMVVTAKVLPGNATLEGPLKISGNTVIAGIPSGEAVRAVAQLDDHGHWLWINRKGQLKRNLGNQTFAFPGEIVGDQLAVSDLIGSSRKEVVTTSVGSIGESDELVVRTLTADGKGFKVLYRPSFQGSIVALTVGHSYYQDLPTVWFVERAPDGTSLLWKLEAGL